MQCNVGGKDRTFRFAAGIVIIVAGIFFKSWWGLLGIIPLGTALLKRCPAYVPFGVSTCKKEEEQKQS
jgi:hypothetical protein